LIIQKKQPPKFWTAARWNQNNIATSVEVKVGLKIDIERHINPYSIKDMNIINQSKVNYISQRSLRH